MTADLVLFPFAEYWWFYSSFTLLVLVLLLLDLGVFHRVPHKISAKEAFIWSMIWISLAMVFNGFLYWYSLTAFASSPRLQSIPDFDSLGAARQVGLEFLTGFVVEKSLAIDNIFVFAIIFSFFAIPPQYQQRILLYGVIGALAFRAIFIALGSMLMAYQAIVVFFGVLLILTGAKMFFLSERKIDPEANIALRLLRRFLPVTQEIEGPKFFLRRNGRLYATPLFVALIMIEVSDIIFAVDSVPAIFAITDEPLIVFTANMFAVLGLRSLYFLLADVVDRFHLLRYGLALVLIFVGLKMAWLNDYFGGKFPIHLSLGIIGSTIVASVVLSLLFPKRQMAC